MKRRVDPLVEQIAKARRQAGVSQRALAAQAFISHRSVSHYETGLTVPTVDVAGRMADALGCRIALVPKGHRVLLVPEMESSEC